MLYLGVDGGGTKTQAVLFDTTTGNIRSVLLGSGNICVLGSDGCRKLFEQIRIQLWEELAPENITASAFAFAGAGRAAEREILKAILDDFGYQNFNILTDAEILHYSFFGPAAGILIAAGTGSVCLMSNPDGTYRQIGGWGYILGDEGSGFHIGKLAIQHALHITDSCRPATKLAQKILDHYKTDTPKTIITQTYSLANPQRFVASCAQTVDKLAQKNDAHALAIINQVAHSLAQLAQVAINLNPDTQLPSIALAGGILSKNTQTTQKLKELLDSQNDSIKYYTQQYHPAVAAAVYAAARTGHNLSEQNKQISLNWKP